MKIVSIQIKNLYGYLNKKVTLNKDINLITGINGSGKTSVLNCINWLLSPSIENLVVTEHETISIIVKADDTVYEVRSKQGDEHHTLEVIADGSVNLFPPISTRLEQSPKAFTKDLAKKNEYLSSLDLHVTPDEEEAFNFIKDRLPSPIVIGLDRDMYAQYGEEITYLLRSESGLRPVRRKRQTTSPVERIVELASRQYLEYKDERTALAKQLSEQLLLSSFEEFVSESDIRKIESQPRINVKEVEALEDKVSSYFREVFGQKSQARDKRTESQLKRVRSYFRQIKRVIGESENRDRAFSLYVLNIAQFKKLEILIQKFEDHEAQVARLFEPFRAFLAAVNDFLSDSGKKVQFDNVSGVLKFSLVKDELNQELRDVASLSSGEKQILILLTFIRFVEKSGGVFIIDEPELSLHPWWQERFLERVKSIMPIGRQLLFATHSPALVGNNRNYCIPLRP